MAVKPFVTVHAGAGFHSFAKEADYVAICKAACDRGLSVLTSNVSALDAVVEVMMSLENATCTNAGTGSNLTLYGTVECDASVMDGRTTAFGAVGAVPRIKNPVCLARRLIEVQAGGLSLGRIPPSILVGYGAFEWAVRQGFTSVNGRELVTETSERTYRKYKKRLLRGYDHEWQKAYDSIKVPDVYPEEVNTTQTFNANNIVHNNNNINNHNNRSCGGRVANTMEERDEETKKRKVNPVFYSGGDIVNNDVSPSPSGSGQQQTVPSLNYTTQNISNNLTAEQATLSEPSLGSTSSSSSSSSSAIGESNPTSTNHISMDESESSKHFDTVGAMCVDSQGNIACAVSSGGLALKQPGRLGSAASFGAGCWALNRNINTPGVGVVTSGTGEHLIRTNFAKEFADCILTETDTTMAVNMAFDLKFFGSPLLKDVNGKYAGTLLVKHKSLNQIELVWSFCTASMCVGYGVAGQESTAFISRLADSQMPGKSLHVQGVQLCL